MANPKEVDIEFPRGDTFVFGFHLVDQEKNPVNMQVGDGEIYFTAKNNNVTSDVVFQKKFSTGDIKRDTDHDGLYYLIIEADDTNTLNYTTLGYDVELKSGDYVSTEVIGTITLTSEFTHKSNE